MFRLGFSSTSLALTVGIVWWFLVMDPQGYSLAFAAGAKSLTVNCSNDEDQNSNATINHQDIMDTCNSSFSIPMDYLVEFNTTGELPDTKDKTGMCFIRCFFEKVGLIDNWKLNKQLIRQIMWPASGDSVEVCEQDGKNETNACTRTYTIAKCLMIRAIVDARDKVAL